MIDLPLTREEMISVIEGRSAARRVPMVYHAWTSADVFGERKSEAADLLNNYPMDVQLIGMNLPGNYDAPEADPEYRWVNYSDPYKGNETIAIDSKVAIPDWDMLDSILADFPNPYYNGLFGHNPESDGRYRMLMWGFCLFERHWSLRGMTNALMDYYTDPESVHRLFRALTDFYLVTIERAAKEIGCDAICTTDDIGMQTSSFFSLEIFREFFKPYYKELIDKAHSLGMHFWLHTCGNVDLFLPEFIEIGLDVIHPIQKYTMDERVVAEKYGSDISIWAGFDVQRVIPWGTPEDVRKEVRFMIDTYFRPEGRLMLTAGNGITGDCTVESLEALFNESLTYGKIKAASVKK